MPLCSSLSPLVTTIYTLSVNLLYFVIFISVLYLFIKIPHISDIIPYLSFSLSLFFLRNSLFSILVAVCGRTAYNHSLVAPTHSVAWGVGATDQSSAEGWAPQSSAGNCWIGAGGTRTPWDQSATSGPRSSELCSRPFSLKLLLGHSLLSCCLLSFFSLFRISVEVEIRHDLPWVFSGDGATHAQNFPGEHSHQTHWVCSLFRISEQDTSTEKTEKSSTAWRVRNTEENKSYFLLCPMSESPSGKREGLSKTMQLSKREVYCWLESGSCRIQRSGAGSESPEPKLLHKFIGWA